jgi:hypothetical protein
MTILASANMTKKLRKAGMPQAIGGTVVILTPPVPIRLSTIRECRLETCRVYRDVKSGTVNSQDGARLVFILVSIAKMIEVEQLEQRMVELERRLLK